MQASPFDTRNKTKTMQGVGANFNKPTRGDKKYFTLENNPAINPKTKANINEENIAINVLKKDSKKAK